MARASVQPRDVSTPRGQPSIVDAMEAFAEANQPPKHPACWVCSLAPELQNALETKRRESPGTWTFRLIARFLREQGHEQANEGRLKNHFANHLDRA